MKKMKRTVITASLCAAFLCGCTLFCPEKVRLITSHDAVRFVTMTSGERGCIRLAGNPTTGYAWSFQVRGEGMIEVLRNGFVPPSELRPGAPGVHEFLFKALRPGKCRVEAVYARSWEKNIEPAKKYEFEFIIQ